MGPQGRHLATALLALAALLVLLSVGGVKVTRTDGAHVGVVRNGGPLDNRKIRQVIPAGSRLVWTGLFSQPARIYPARHVQLLYKVTADPSRGDRNGVDVVTVPTKDGVQVGIEGTVFLHFVGTEDSTLLRRFDSTYGWMSFPVPRGGTRHAWDGDDGFQAMLDQIFRPVFDNDLRQEVGAFNCAELLASCALVRRAATTISSSVAENSNANIAAIQNRINRSLANDLQSSLGGSYFRDIRFRVARVTLPVNVQQAVDQVQAKYTAVNGARAELRQARYERQRNRLLGQSYKDSPQLAMIDAVRAAPKGTQIIISAGSSSGSPGVNVGH